jgi:hypothetical protein
MEWDSWNFWDDNNKLGQFVKVISGGSIEARPTLTLMGFTEPLPNICPLFKFCGEASKYFGGDFARYSGVDKCRYLYIIAYKLKLIK